MPSSVDASAETGTTDKPCSASGATCSSRFSLDRLTATTVAPAWAAIAGDRGADAAAARARHHDDAAVQPQKVVHVNCPDNIWCSAYCRTLFRRGYRLVKAGRAADSAYCLD